MSREKERDNFIGKKRKEKKRKGKIKGWGLGFKGLFEIRY
jgi:hypothetical protein